MTTNYLTAFKDKLQSLTMEILRIHHFCNTVFCNIGASIIFQKGLLQVYFEVLRFQDYCVVFVTTSFTRDSL
jgi:nucleoside recognition membrane protein YjiH